MVCLKIAFEICVVTCEIHVIICDYISQTPVEIYEKTNGKACLSCALAHI